MASGRKSSGSSSSPGAPGDGHRAEQRPDRGDPDVRQCHRADRVPADPGEEHGKRRQGHDLGGGQEEEHRKRLAEPDRAAVARREDKCVEEALLALGHERAGERQERREDERHPEESERGDVTAAVRQGEMEDRERRDHEEQHRGQRLLGSELEQQILARERGDVAEVVHANASRSVANRSTRCGSWVATT